MSIGQPYGQHPTEPTGASSSVSSVSDDVERREHLSTRDLVRWSEALAAIARTGLGFTQNLYERERFEEVLRVAADIKMAANEVLLAAEERREHAHLVEEWMESIGVDVPGYVTPKVAIGAVVGNDRGEILLVQRADSGFWLYPTGWADVGYSPAEVAVKEVAEETGIACEPEQLLAVIDGQRMGFSRFAMYMLLFHCTATGGELAAASAGDRRRRLVRRGRAPGRHGRRAVVGAEGLRGDPRRALPHHLRRRPLTRSGAAEFGLIRCRSAELWRFAAPDSWSTSKLVDRDRGLRPTASAPDRGRRDRGYGVAGFAEELFDLGDEARVVVDVELAEQLGRRRRRRRRRPASPLRGGATYAASLSSSSRSATRDS